ncbi:MAG: hypothetical protein HC933_00215 [Pleurocapsa sp. SU_196_0]|nr:hypothetical protein [Pleurocapsa sp. SU_196_0]
MKKSLTAITLLGAALVACNLQTATPVAQYTLDDTYIANSWFVELEGEPGHERDCACKACSSSKHGRKRRCAPRA